tara:strand:+ start:2087 stop:2950 length:864 start_codon:yes stop_codon:yes gene_type:complete
MKLAICLFGNIGISENASQRQKNVNLLKESDLANTDPKICYQALKTHFMEDYDTDVFIHSWSKKYENILKEIYNPIDSKFENQIDFTTSLEKYGISESNEIEDWDVSDLAKESYKLLLPSRGSVENIKKDLKNLTFRTHSRWYSTYQSVNLMTSYANSKSINYDYVLLTRFDCLFKKSINLKLLDNQNFYCSLRKNRDDFGMALYDFFFLSNPKLIQEFSNLYENIYNYSIRPPFASMEHTLTFLSKLKIKHVLDFMDDYDKVRTNITNEKRFVDRILNKLSKNLFN